MRRLSAVVAAFTLPLVSVALIDAGAAHAAVPSIIVSEVAPWGSSASYASDWFELTNTGATTVDLTGWKMDDNSHAFATAVPLAGVTSLPAGGSAVFFEATSAANAPTQAAAFAQAWYGTGAVPTGASLGYYTGSGVGLSATADEVSIWDSTGTLVTGVGFGASTTNVSFDNAAGIGGTTATSLPKISTLSAVGTNGGFTAHDGLEVGSPFRIAAPSADSAVKINEVDPTNETVELTSAADVDVNGWILKNGSGTLFSIPASTPVSTGGHVNVTLPAGFLAPAGDTVTLLDGAVQVDTTSWSANPVTSWGRCPDGTGSFRATFAASPSATNICANPADAQVKINEVDPATQKIELTSTAAADVSGWIVENAAATPYTIPASTSVAAGGHTAVTLPASFFTAAGDTATLLDGTNQVDTTSWSADPVTSWGRCPDGTGSFGVTHAATDGATNDCTTTTPPPSPGIRISEVETNGDALGDWIELTNTSSASIDISGWVMSDNDKLAYSPAQLATYPTQDIFTVPAGTSIPAGGFLTVFSTYDASATYPANTLVGSGFGFGLGTPDEARIFNPAHTLVDGVAWTPHEAGATYQRCPNATQNVQFTDSADSANFTNSFISSPGAANDCHPPIRINELDANGNNDGTLNDWVELTNIGTAPVDLNGWILTDDKNTDVDTITATTPTLAGTLDTTANDGSAKLAPGAYVAFRVDSATDFPSPSVSFGLGASGDEVRLYEPGAWSAGVYDDTKRVDAIAWGSDATAPVKNGVTVTNPGYATWPSTPATLGRCSDGKSEIVANGTGAWAQTAAPTAAAANSCTGLVNATPWPDSHHGQAVTTADNVDLGQNMSGLFYVAGATPAQDYMWGIQNGSSTLAGANPGDGGSLYKLVKDGSGNWGPATGWEKGRTVRYLGDSTGEVDSEGVTAVHGQVFVTSERDNTNSLVSKIAVLQVDPANPVAHSGDVDGDLPATHEWDLGSDLGPGGALNTGLSASNPGDANLGLEGMTFVPDRALTHGGFVDANTQAAYDPASYPNHVDGGLFFVAMEKNGAIYAYALNSDNTFQHVATIPSGFPTLMDLLWDPTQDALRATCDNSCQGESSLLKIGADGAFHVTEVDQRPSGAVDNLNNEGFTEQPASECANGSRSVWWSDDTDDAQHWLRTAAIDCTTPISGQVGATVTAAVDVQGTTTPAVASPSGWYNTALTVRFTCTDGDAVINQACPGPVDVSSTQAAGSAGTLTDTLGNVYDAAIPALNIDTTAPSASAITITGPSGATANANPSFTFSSTDSDVVSYRCKLSPAASYSDCSSGLSASALVDGDYTLSVESVDHAGNASAPATRMFTVDTVAPSVTFSTTPPAFTSSGTPTLRFGSVEATATFKCSLDGSAFTVCTSPVTPTLSDGAHTFKVEAVDAAGNVGGPITESFTVDTAAPTVSVGGVVGGTTYQTAPTPTCVASDAGSGIASCTLQDAAAGTHHTVTVTATDKAGNTATAAATYNLVPPVKVPPVTGKPKVGRTLKVTIALPSGATATYQWFAGKKAIKHATKSKLKLTRKLRHARIRVRVTVTVPGEAPESTTLTVGKPVR